MARNLKIAGGAALAGMMMAVAIVSASHRPAPAAPPPAVRESAPDPIIADMRRCRTLTMPDSGCEAAWEAKRRRFFGKDER
ncbi:putative entry exclusion protein TrbK-alt [Sphingobium sp. H39-3-25]|uniref:putative entry exclusion protein TrbK-alt n=1 Tax=Sphingobium arseniciresistens TaxID=3030834 RepID=UPI0023B9CE6D|nr:putative entry exclusion protein TrbK-alt [Sphingobium arseniciresistens]